MIGIFETSIFDLYLLNCLAGSCLQSIFLVRRALTVVTKEEARNMERRMSWLVGNNQQHCKDKQTNRLASSIQANKQTNEQTKKSQMLLTQNNQNCKKKIVFLINCLMGNWQEVGCSGGWMGRSISLPTPITGPRSRGHFLGRFTIKSGLIKSKRQICTMAPQQAPTTPTSRNGDRYE